MSRYNKNKYKHHNLVISRKMFNFFAKKFQFTKIYDTI